LIGEGNLLALGSIIAFFSSLVCVGYFAVAAFTTVFCSVFGSLLKEGTLTWMSAYSTGIDASGDFRDF
jgi:hypothetical protein